MSEHTFASDEAAAATLKLTSYNRDAVRRAAKAAGVSNVTYKSKPENIAAMVQLGVVDIELPGIPVHSSIAGGSLADIADSVSEQDEVDQVVAEVIAQILDEVEIGLSDDEGRELEHLVRDVSPDAAREYVRNLEASLDDEYSNEPDEDEAPIGLERLETAQEAAARVAEHLLAGQSVATWDDGIGLLPPPTRAYSIADDGIGLLPPPTRAYSIATNLAGQSVATWVQDGELKSVAEDHVGYLQVVGALVTGADPLPCLDVKTAVHTVLLERLGDRVVLLVDEDGNGEVHLDGEPIHGRLAQLIQRYHLEGRDLGGVLSFLEKLNDNPVPSARRWLFNFDGFDRGNIAIDSDGNFIGFKAVFPIPSPPGSDGSLPEPGERLYASQGSGWGTVDGVQYGTPDGRVKLPQKVGSVVTMPARDVKPGPECSDGLHVGSWGYAQSFANKSGCVMEVRVNPADVVNVPPSETGKMRVVKYTVEAIHDNRNGTAHGVSTFKGNGNASHHEAEATFDEEAVSEVVVEAGVPRTFWEKITGRRKGGE